MPDIIAKHAFDSVDNFAHGGGRGQRLENKRIQGEQYIVARKESMTWAGGEVLKAVVGIGLEVHAVAEKDYMTIDVYASKKDPNERRFEVSMRLRRLEFQDLLNGFNLTNESGYSHRSNLPAGQNLAETNAEYLVK